MLELTIAVPTAGTIEIGCFESIFRLDKEGVDVSFDHEVGYVIHHSREKLAKRAVESGRDFILFVDSDVAFKDPMSLHHLLSHDAPVVFGYYPRRNGKKGDDFYDGRSSLVKGSGRPDYSEYHSCADILGLREKGVTELEVYGAGLGCALVRTDVFQKLDEPWFFYRRYSNGNVLSEDYHFCSRCHAAGIKLLADTRVALRHLYRTWQDPEE